MSIVFLAIATVMAALAVGFVLLPQKRVLVSHRSAGSTLPMLIIPLVAVSGYALLGSPDAMTAQPTHQKLYPKHLVSKELPVNKSVASVNSLLAGLEERLEREPEDAEGWLLLAKSYRHLGQPAKAHRAYVRASALGITDDSFARDAPSPPGAADDQRSSPVATESDGPVIRGRIELSDDVAEQITAKDTVFIFAKTTKDQRMPLVAIRRPAVELPFDFVLSDRDILLAGTSMAEHETLIVSARLSRSGLATDSEGALEVRSEPFAPTAAERIDLILASNHRLDATNDE